MNQYDEALKATDTALNSSGSGYRENAEYLKSFEAQINMVKNAWTEAVIAMRDSGLGDAMILGLNIGLEFLNFLTAIIDKIGVLPTLIIGGSLALALISDRFKNITVSISKNSLALGKWSIDSIRNFNMVSASAQKTAYDINKMTFSTASSGIGGNFATLGTSAKTATVATTGLAASVRTLGITLASIAAPIAIFAVLGAGISYATQKLMEHNQQQKELKEAIEKRADSDVKALTTNKEETEELIKTYENLSRARNSEYWDTEKEEEYLRVQQQLGELFPSLIGHIDDKGQYHLVEADSIEEVVKATEKLIEARKELLINSAKETYKENLDTIVEEQKELGKLEERYNSIKGTLDNLSQSEKDSGFVYNATNNTYTSIEELEKILSELNEQIALQEIQLYGSFSKMRKHFVDVANAQLNQMSSEVRPIIVKAMNDIAKEFTFDGMDEAEVASISNQFVAQMEKMADAIEKGSKEAYHEARKSTISFLESQGMVRDDILNLIPAFEESRQAIENKKKAQQESNNVDEDGNIITDEQNEKTKEKISLLEQLAGVTEGNIKTTEELIFSVDHLTRMQQALGEGQELSAEHAELLATSQKQLLDMYPHIASEGLKYMDVIDTLSQSYGSAVNSSEELARAEENLIRMYPELEKTGINRLSLMNAIIKKIEEEAEANDLILAATKASAAGKLTADQERALSSADSARTIINNINQEILALDDLRDAYKGLYNRSRIGYDEAVREFGANSPQAESAARSMMRMSQMAGSAENQRASKLASLSGIMEGYIADLSVLRNAEEVLSRTTSKGNKALHERMKEAEKAAKASAKANKTTDKANKESIYITDEYKLAIEALRLEMTKLQRIKEQYPKHSAEYRKAVEAEMKLAEQQLKLAAQQRDSVAKQIRSGAIQQTGNISPTTTTTKQNLSGWGRQTSNYGMRFHPIDKINKMHHGIDLAGARGTRLDANIGGKVAFAGNRGDGFGNYVVIQTEDGLKHIYAHLDKIAVKLGQTISAGMQIGNIGATGKARGSHLHYEVRNQSGQSINPSKFVEQAKKGVTTTTSTASTVSNTQQSIDKAKSDLVSLETDMLNASKLIEQLKVDLIDSQLAHFDQYRSSWDRVLAFEDEKLKSIDKTSQRYVLTLDRYISSLQNKQKANRDELAYLEQMQKRGDLSAVTLEQLKIRTDELRTGMLALNAEIQQITFDKIMDSNEHYRESVSEIDYLIERSNLIRSEYEEGSAAYKRETETQIKLMEDKKKAIEGERKSLQQLILTENLSVEGVKALTERIRQLSLDYRNATLSIIGYNKALEDSNNALYDKLLSYYKDYVGETRDRHMKALEDEAKAEDENHRKKMDNYRKELDAFRKLVQARIDEIDRQENERQYQKDISNLEEERLEILNKINILSLDDSYEAKAERKRLQQDLAKIDSDIFERQNRKEIEDRKESLDDMLKDKEEYINDLEKQEQNRHDDVKKRLDREKQYWQQHYNDLLNNERKFAKLREDIIAGNFDAISEEFHGFLSELISTMPELEDTLDGTMKAVGTAIRQNIIDNLREALDLMNSISNGSGSSGGSNSGGSSGGSSGGGSSISSADLKVMTAKYLMEDLRWKEENPVRRGYIKDRADSMAAQARSEGATIGANVSFGEALGKMSQSDRIAFADYLQRHSGSIVDSKNSPQLASFLNDYIKRLRSSGARLDTGGMTPSFNGERLAFLHGDEIINNPVDSKRLLDLASVLESVVGGMALRQRSETNSGNNDSSIKIDLHIEKMIANEHSARELADMVSQYLAGAQKRIAGVRRNR